VALARNVWINHRQPFMRNMLTRLAFIDETSLKTNMAKTTFADHPAVQIKPVLGADCDGAPIAVDVACHTAHAAPPDPIR
jgi:hypothetical protein